jgi:hypothetical protein
MNDVAEYSALIVGLQAAIDHGLVGRGLKSTAIRNW